MTNQQHPITPPFELVEEWADDMRNAQHFATQAARWGADTELEACVEWLEQNCGRWDLPAALRTARRLKPQNLKERALAVIENSAICDHLSTEHAAILRRALEQLDD